MSGQQPLLSIVIPTRNRAAYLPAVLRTVLEQSFEGFEVLVMDNASTDGTAELVADLQDSRVRYIPSDQILGMSENWERGLQFTRGDYVFFLGADDGVLPEALADVSLLIKRFKPPAITWQKPNYTWPDADPPSSLQLALPGPSLWVDSHMILRLLCGGWTNYGLLPNIYSSFVDRTFIDRIRLQRGRFFSSITPDVYSAISLVADFRYFLFSPYPFSVNGGSGASTGMSSARPGGLDSFLAGTGPAMHSGMPVIPGSISSSVLEALLTANEDRFQGRLRISSKRYLKHIVRELDERHPEIRSKGVATLRGLDLSASERNLVESLARRGSGRTVTGGDAGAGDSEPQYESRSNVVSISDCESLGARDVYDAAKLVRALVGPYHAPQKVRRLSWGSLGVEIVQRGATRVLRRQGASLRGPTSVLDF